MTEIIGNDPMASEASPARVSGCCGAKTRQGGRCGQIAMANGRCRFHGGLSTGPKTTEGLERMRASKTRHGWYGKEGRRLRMMVQDLRAASKMIEEMA